MINPETLVDYMHRFVGFGDPSADIWFIGLEQGGGEDLGELERRLSAWIDSGAGPFADLREYCSRLGEHRPKAVVFLGISESNTWSEIAQGRFVEGPAGACWARVGSTRYVVVTHPTAHGAKNAYFEEVGRELAA